MNHSSASKVLNDLIVESNTRVVANYDADCILPIPHTKKHMIYY